MAGITENYNADVFLSCRSISFWQLQQRLSHLADCVNTERSPQEKFSLLLSAQLIQHMSPYQRENINNCRYCSLSSWKPVLQLFTEKFTTVRHGLLKNIFIGTNNKDAPQKSTLRMMAMRSSPMRSTRGLGDACRSKGICVEVLGWVHIPWWSIMLVLTKGKQQLL